MAEKYTVAAYWGPRAEPVEQCAGRLRTYLDGLGRAHPALASWYRKKGRVDDRFAGDTGEDELRDLLLAGRNRRDADGSVIEELGYQVALWNRENALATALSVFCGATAQTPNSTVLSLPVEETPELTRTDVMRVVVEAMVRAWEPDWATFISRSDRSAQQELPPPTVGLLTYAGPGFVVDAGDLPLVPLGPGSLVELPAGAGFEAVRKVVRPAG